MTVSVLAPGLDQPDCLRLYRKLAAGVTVVTSQGAAGPVGMTASAVTSVSVEPPILLLCLRSGSHTLESIRGHQGFAVHLLRDDQHGRARAFADPRNAPADRFAGVDFDCVLGVPVLADALAWSVCALEEERTYGDHAVVLGRVVAAGVNEGEPLLWHDSTFARLERGL